MTFRTTVRLGILLLGIALVAVSGCVLYSFHIRWEAAKFLRVMQQLRVGSATREEARIALEPFHKYEIGGTAMINGKTYRTQIYRFENTGVHLLGIFHPSRFQGGVTFGDGIVIEKGCGFLTEPFRSVTTREWATRLIKDSALDDSQSGMLVGVYDPPVRMAVSLDARASDADRSAAYEYSLDCFTSLTGCQSVYEILPAVKQQATR